MTRDPADFVGLVDKTTHASSLPPAISATLRFRSQLSECGPWSYEMRDLGYNYRLTDIQCALGRSQLSRLPEFVARRQAIAVQYNEALADLEWLKIPKLATSHPSPATSGNFSFAPSDLSLHLCTVEIDFARLGKTRTEVMQELRDQGVGSQVLYIPVYLQPWYRRTFGYAPGKCPNAEAFYARALTLPLYPAMKNADVKLVFDSLKHALTS